MFFPRSSRTFVRSTAVVAAVIVAASAQAALIYDWTPALDGFWSDAGRFVSSPSAGTRDLYRISAVGAAYTVTDDIDLSGIDLAVNSADATLRANGRTWTDVNAIWNAGTAQLSNMTVTGSLGFLGTSTSIVNLSMAGTVSALNGNTVTFAGTIFGAGAGISLAHDATSAITLDAATLTGKVADAAFSWSANGDNALVNTDLAGTVEMTGGYARVFGNSGISGQTTLHGTSLNVQDSSALNVAAGGLLDGAGSVNRANTSSFSTMDGTIQADGGTLYWDVWQGSGAGTLTATDGSTLVLRGAFNGAGTGAMVGTNGTGVVQLDGGGFSGLFKRLEVALSPNGDNYLSNATANGGAFTGGYARVFGNVNLNGTVDLRGTTLNVQDSSALNVGGTGSLVGYGSVNRANTSSFSTMDGEVRASGGTLYWDVWQGGGAGTLTSEAGSALVLRGVFNGNLASVDSGPGNVILDGGGMTGTFETLNLSLSGDGANFLSNLTSFGSGSLTGGFARVFGNVSLKGPTTLNGATLNVQDSSALNVGAAGSLVGSGNVSRANTSSFSTMDGTLKASGGTLYWDVWQGQGQGTLTADAGSTLVLRGVFDGTGLGARVLPGDGSVALDGGGLSGLFRNLQVSLSTDGANYFSNATTVGASSFTGGYGRVFGNTNLNAATTLDGANLNVQDSSALNVGAGGSLVGHGAVERANTSSFSTLDGALKADGGVLKWNVWQGSGEGTLTAASGSTLALGGVFNGTGAGAILGPDAGGTVLLDGGGLSGTFRRLDLALSANGDNFLSNLTTTGSGGFTDGYGRVFGNVTLGGATTISNATLDVQDSSALNVTAAGSLVGSGNVSRANTSSFSTMDGTVRAKGGNLFWDVWQGSGQGTFSAEIGASLVLRGLFNGTGLGAKVGPSEGGFVFLQGGGLTGNFRQLDVTLGTDGNSFLSNVTTTGPASFLSGYARAFGTETFAGATKIVGAQLDVQDSSAIVVPVGGSLRGSGTVSRANTSSSATVDGELFADGSVLRFDPWQVTNRGRVGAVNGSELDFGGVYGQTAGALVADGVVSFEQGATVSGGRIEGTGEIEGTLTNLGGTLAPGHSAGTLSLFGNYKQGSAATYAVEIGGTGFGESDLFDTNGTASLDGSLSLSLLGGYDPALGTTFRVLTALGGVTGTFSGGYDASMWQVVYGAGYVDVVRAVPEPTSMAALARRRRRAIRVARRD